MALRFSGLARLEVTSTANLRTFREKFMKKTSPVSRSGRFKVGPAKEVMQFTQSISFDWRLWRQDIRGSRAHAAMLAKIGVLRSNELRAIQRALDGIEREIEAGK